MAENQLARSLIKRAVHMVRHRGVKTVTCPLPAVDGHRNYLAARITSHKLKIPTDILLSAWFIWEGEQWGKRVRHVSSGMGPENALKAAITMVTAMRSELALKILDAEL